MAVEKVEGKSYNPQEELLELLRTKFPEVFSEGKVDCQKVRKTLGEDVAADGERYGLSWAGKTDCFRHIQEGTSATLRPVREESVDFDNTENIFIEGDNLQVLKVLQKSYYGKIKMIYIDPPYNTGNDSFIYPDRFAESKEEYLQRIGDKDIEGNLMRDGFFRKNNKDAGHFHSNWLSMMYPRLFLARNLLRQDGVIFVSIDDNEVHNLRGAMDEIFGEQNFIDCIVWKKRYGGGAKEKQLVTIHEYVLVYSKDAEELGEIFVSPDKANEEKYYKGRDEKYEVRGPYRTHPLEAGKAMGDRPNLIFSIQAPDGSEVLPKRQWLWSKERAGEALRNNELEFAKDKDGNWTVHTKQYWRDEDGNVRQAKAFSIIDDVYTQHGTNEGIAIFGNARVFPYPKPVQFIRRLLDIGCENDKDIVLDFFAGACTTADAVMQLNGEDAGSRKYICVQLAEPCEEDSDAHKASFKTIADIGKERIRRAAKKIRKEKQGKLEFEKDKVDLGFKVFKLEQSNFKVWRSDVRTADKLQKRMSLFVDNVKAEANQENILYELILKSGLDLNVSIEKKKANGKQYFVVDGGKLIICLEDRITQKLVDGILKAKPKKVVCLDKAFGGNDQLKTNTALQMETEGIEFKVI